MHTANVAYSDSLEQATQRFLDDLQAWVEDCIERYRDAPPTDVHDQLTYTVPWSVLIQHRGHDAALAFKCQQRDAVRQHFIDTGQWHHGYWKKQEAHHGTEHFELFLQSLWRSDAGDTTTIETFIDAAEHVGNWIDGLPAWVDQTTGLFRSAWLGTQYVGQDAGDEINTPDHLRFVTLCLIAHEMTGESRYLAFVQQYAHRWAEPIARGELPTFLLPPGVAHADEHDAAYGKFVGMAGDLSNEVDRAENLLASDAVAALLTINQRCGDSVCRDAARRLIEAMIGDVADPAAGPLADAVRHYRDRTGDGAFDQAVKDAVAAFDRPQTIGIEPIVKRDRRPSGIGKRKDMPSWFEDGQPRRFNPITLYVAGRIDDNEDQQVAAIDLGRTYFNLARQVYSDGRDHGCSARSVSAIARGHGRDNNAGMVTAILDPALQLLDPPSTE
jgi:hypothetical protein